MIQSGERAINVFSAKADQAAAPFTSNPVNDTRLAAAQVYATLTLAAAVSDLANAINAGRQ